MLPTPVHRSLAAGAILLALALVSPAARPLLAQANGQGQWRTLPYVMPINPIHLALMHTGKVLVIAGSGNVATETNFQAAVWDPQAVTNAFVQQALGWDMFCNGMSVLPDGRVFINGGNLKYDPFWGEPRNASFDPATNTFTDLQNMAHGRWYPTVTTLGDGRVMTFSGLLETGGTNKAVEIYTAGTGWSQEYPASWTPPLYPRMHLISDGRVFYSGSGTGSRFFNPATKAWSGVIATMKYATARRYGTSVLLPLTPANGYRSRVMVFGGGNPATETTEIIDLSVATPQWQYGPAMSQKRIEMNATILPNGKVLAVGGSTNDEDVATASLNADLYDPIANTFSPAGRNAYPRLYHSASLLLPDATVMLAGGNPARGSYEKSIEIYSPAYLFAADGSPASRPTITSITPGTVSYGATFQVQTAEASDIASVVLVRPGAPTHAFDMEQRLIGLSYTAGSGVLNVIAPPSGNIAPPGYYMLFVLNAAGVPSRANFVRLSTSAPANQPPVATIVSPSSADVTVTAGAAVTFEGTGTDPDGSIGAYAWTFPGGSPASASVASPGNVVYPTAGTYVASFTVTDNAGLQSEPATRTIRVTDFSLSATPASQSVLAGGGTTYSATVVPQNGFSGTVSFAVTGGLPSGATASFSPVTVAAGGSTTLTLATSTTTPAGSYPLTVAAVSGPLTHTLTLTLVVASGDFSIAVTPSSRTISKGGSASYTVTVTPVQGFSGTVVFSVSGVPKLATAKFSPTSVVNTGTSTLSLTSKRNVVAGTSTLIVKGTSGGRVRSANVTLVIQ